MQLITGNGISKRVVEPNDALHDRVNGKVVLLTGASSGIGAEVGAISFAAAGATVLLVKARARDKLETIAEDIRKERWQGVCL